MWSELEAVWERQERREWRGLQDGVLARKRREGGRGSDMAEGFVVVRGWRESEGVRLVVEGDGRSYAL